MKKVTLDQVKSKALETAQRLVDYESYGQSEARALTALRKRCMGWEKEEIEPWLLAALSLHKDGLRFADKHSSRLYELHKADRPLRFYDIDGDFFEKHEGFSKETINQHLGFIFYYHHLR